MVKAGSLVSAGGAIIYVFGVVGNPNDFDSYSNVIGVDLDSNKVVDYSSYLTTELELSNLTSEQQLSLAKFMPIRHALQGNIITISGKARTGKDTVADIIADQVSNAIKRPLATPIYEISKTINGDSVKKDRPSLIMIGQGLREKDPNIWLKVWLRNVIEILQTHPFDLKFIVPDTRQPNEFLFFKSMGAVSIKTQAQEEKRIEIIKELDGEEASKDEKLLNDETELHSEGFETDYVVVNNYDDRFFEDVARLAVDL